MRYFCAALIAAVVLAGCGGSDGSGGGGKYPKQVEDNFMASCTAQPKANQAYCRCALDKLEQTLSYDEFKKADQAIRSLNGASAKAKSAFEQATTGCRGKL